MPHSAGMAGSVTSAQAAADCLQQPVVHGCFACGTLRTGSAAPGRTALNSATAPESLCSVVRWELPLATPICWLWQIHLAEAQRPLPAGHFVQATARAAPACPGSAAQLIACRRPQPAQPQSAQSTQGPQPAAARP